jgi:hypothetical protein
MRVAKTLVLLLAPVSIACSDVWGFSNLSGDSGAADALPEEDGGFSDDATPIGDAARDGATIDGKLGDDGGPADRNVLDVQPTSKVVFISSATYQVPDSVASADAQCQSLANAAHLPGTFKAWLSDDTTNASSRMSHANVPYVLVNGTVVANNWGGLTSGTLVHGIDATEYGGVPPAAQPSTIPTAGTCRSYCTTDSCSAAFTGTYSDMTEDWDCDNWKWSSGNVYDDAGHSTYVTLGSPTNADGRWTAVCYTTCDATAALYCVEQ